VYAALVLGTRDYVRKNGFEKVVIGLSGGLDSSIVATIAVDALGPENVIGVSMPSRFSSEGSKTDAQELAQNLGIKLLTIPIEDAYKAYLDMLAQPFASTEFRGRRREPSGRIRGNILMGLSNVRMACAARQQERDNAVPRPSTATWPEASPSSGVPKTLVYKIAAYRNANGRPVIPEAPS
jgi:NAD+ synthase (glutamine-hydrolysing)